MFNRMLIYRPEAYYKIHACSKKRKHKKLSILKKIYLRIEKNGYACFSKSGVTFGKNQDTLGFFTTLPRENFLNEYFIIKQIYSYDYQKQGILHWKK